MKSETKIERQLRHEAHQEMLEWHKLRKVLSKERHREGWHRMKIIPLHLL